MCRSGSCQLFREKRLSKDTDHGIHERVFKNEGILTWHQSAVSHTKEYIARVAIRSSREECRVWFASKLAIAAASRCLFPPPNQATMDISTASGSNELPDLETSASPIDPALTGISKGKRKADGGDDGEGDDGGAANNKKRRNRKVRAVRLRNRRVLTF
jgi:hypothetical protein